MDTLYQEEDLVVILIAIHCFVDDVLKAILTSLSFAIERPGHHHPPRKQFNLPLAELITLALFRFFTGHRNWKDYYRFLKTYHRRDFPRLPDYSNFVKAMNTLAPFAVLLLSSFCIFFKARTGWKDLKIADSSKLEVCKIKREFSHRVCKRIASKSKSTMGWFYGFRLHLICNLLLQILEVRITTATVDDRKGLEMMWADIFGIIVADAGYVGKEVQARGMKTGKFLFAAVRNNMRKLMTKMQHAVLKLRQNVETVLSVLKCRLGLETSLPRSELGHFAHYMWCLTAYQLRKFFDLFFHKPISA